MGFKEWREKEKQEIENERIQDIKDWGGPSPTLDDRLINEYNNYETHLLVEKTQNLVKVTWLLAVASTSVGLISIILFLISLWFV